MPNNRNIENSHRKQQYKNIKITNKNCRFSKHYINRINFQTSANVLKCL